MHSRSFYDANILLNILIFLSFCCSELCQQLGGISATKLVLHQETYDEASGKIGVKIGPTLVQLRLLEVLFSFFFGFLN